MNKTITLEHTTDGLDIKVGNYKGFDLWLQILPSMNKVRNTMFYACDENDDIHYYGNNTDDLIHKIDFELNKNGKIVGFKKLVNGDEYRVRDFNGLGFIERKITKKWDMCGDIITTDEAIRRLKNL